MDTKANSSIGNLFLSARPSWEAGKQEPAFRFAVEAIYDEVDSIGAFIGASKAGRYVSLSFETLGQLSDDADAHGDIPTGLRALLERANMPTEIHRMGTPGCIGYGPIALDSARRGMIGSKEPGWVRMTEAEFNRLMLVGGRWAHYVFEKKTKGRTTDGRVVLKSDVISTHEEGGRAIVETQFFTAADPVLVDRMVEADSPGLPPEVIADANGQATAFGRIVPKRFVTLGKPWNGCHAGSKVILHQAGNAHSASVFGVVLP